MVFSRLNKDKRFQLGFYKFDDIEQRFTIEFSLYLLGTYLFKRYYHIFSIQFFPLDNGCCPVNIQGGRAHAK